MATTTTASVPPAFPVHRFTVDQYHQMIRANILNEDDDVELLEGYIVPKMARGDPHDVVIETLNRLLFGVVPATYAHRCQCAITLPDSEPEPDFAVCTPTHTRPGRHPLAAETFVVIEVSDSTLYHDRRLKQRVYARACIPVYWIVNLVDRQIEVYADPHTPPGGDPQYRSRAVYRPGQQEPLVLAGTAVGAISVDAVLP